MSDPPNYLRPLGTPELKELMQKARIRYQFKRNQLIKGLGRIPTSKEMHRVANGDIFVLHLGSALLRGRGEIDTIPKSFLVQIYMTMLRT
jgi:hypothetical protein